MCKLDIVLLISVHVATLIVHSDKTLAYLNRLYMVKHPVLYTSCGVH